MYRNAELAVIADDVDVVTFGYRLITSNSNNNNNLINKLIYLQFVSRRLADWLR